ESIRHNINEVAVRGRDPALRLRRNGSEILLRDWANEIFEKMALSSELLDKGSRAAAYGPALAEQHAKVADADLTPSARILADMADHKEEFYHFALRMSRQHQQWFASRPLQPEQLAAFEQTARESIEAQRRIEAEDDISFETFMQNYFAQSL
ncbi:MAG: glutamate--cysteine ligase, partial [Gammaproteobacteria bacterium]